MAAGGAGEAPLTTPYCAVIRGGETAEAPSAVSPSSKLTGRQESKVNSWKNRRMRFFRELRLVDGNTSVLQLYQNTAFVSQKKKKTVIETQLSDGERRFLQVLSYGQ